MNDAILQGMALEPEEHTPTVLEFRQNLGLVVQQTINNVEVQLKSAVGMDYSKLRDFLAY